MNSEKTTLVETQAKVLANPGFCYKFSPIHGILQYHIQNCFIRFPDESGIEISESWEQNLNKSHIGTHCTVVVQLQLCNVAKYTSKSSIEIN